MSDISDGLIILATLAGPVLAVQAQKWVERATEKRRRKLQIFYTLMATRGTRLSPEHIQALNTIELEFGRGRFRGAKEKAVIDTWRIYFDRLNEKVNETDPAALATWHNRNDDAFVELMYAMSQALKYDFDRVQLKRGVYYPRSQAENEAALRAIQQGLVKVLGGDQAIAMDIQSLPITKEAAELQSKINEQYLKALSGQGALHVAIRDAGPAIAPGL
jgi:hypothetical protein